MRIAILLVTALVAWRAGALRAATIRGVVVEDATGHPLARALIVAHPVAGATAEMRSVRSDSNGRFELAGLPPGAYLLLASRRGFAPVPYGQKQGKGSGVPLEVGETSEASVEIRLPRYGAISGAVLDENDVGLPDCEVVAYRDSHPPTPAAHATTDDRGRYRIWGLEPGTYLVRTAGLQYEDGDYLPTFSRQTARVAEAIPADVALDRETGNVDIRPFPGRFVTVTGYAWPMAAVTLLADFGSQTVSADANGNFRFPPVPPGPYELSARAQAGRPRQNLAAWQAISVDRNAAYYQLRLAPLPQLQVRLEDPQGQAIDAPSVQILIRRKDLSGAGPSETFRPPQLLPPGRYELALAPSPSWYAAGFNGRARAEGWNEFELTASAEVKFILSPHPARIHGIVQDRGKPAAGVPVYLEADGIEPRMIRTDSAGQYEFYGLAPGSYRLLATFEARGTAGSRTIELTEGQDQTADLDLAVSQ